MWCLFDSTPSGWCKTNAHSTDFASNWLERLPAGSISTWEDLTTHFLAQFFPPRRTAKLHNDILINAKESWALLEDLALYDNGSWNDPSDFAKPVKAISLPQDVLSTSDRRLIKLENQVQRLMEAHLAPKHPIQVNKSTPSCKICSSPYDTQYCMENPEQAFVKKLYGNINVASIDQNKNEELRSKGIKSPSKLLSSKYLSQVSLEEQNRNPSSPKQEKVEEESEDEFEEEVEEEEEEEEEDVKYFDTFPTLEELGYHDWLSKYPKPSWVKAKIKDTTSVIDHDLGAVVFGEPFVKKSRLIYDKKEVTVMFGEDNERLIFKMPHKMEMFKNVNFTGVSNDRILPFVIGGDDDGNEKTHY
ncbi:MAK10-like protein [Tanacetum coccineum]